MREAGPPPCMGRGWRGSAAEQRPGGDDAGSGRDGGVRGRSIPWDGGDW